MKEFFRWGRHNTEDEEKMKPRKNLSGRRVRFGKLSTSARSKQESPAIWRSGTSSGRRSLCIGSASIHCTSACGRADDGNDHVHRRGTLACGLARLLARGAGLALSPSVLAQVDIGAAIVASIVAKGEAVYGINTGFGKLANMRIADRRSRNPATQPRAVACGGCRRTLSRIHRTSDDGAETRQPWPRRIGRAARNRCSFCTACSPAVSFPWCRRADRSARRAISRLWRTWLRP